MEEIFFKIGRDHLALFIQDLRRRYVVWAPVKRTGQVDFQTDFEPSRINLEYNISQLGVKKIFFPAKEILFEVERGTAKIPKIDKPAAVLGAHPVDLIGLQRLDESFSVPPADFYWQRRRKDCLIIGVSPSSNKYFTATLAPVNPVRKGGALSPALSNGVKLVFDMFFYPRKEYYLVEIGSQLGKATASRSRLFQPVRPPKKPKKLTKVDFDKILSDPLKVSQIIENSYRSKVWRQLGKICLNCGICTYVCPLCYCFTCEDRLAARGDSCVRCRNWDACTLAGFSEISGGHNFRPEPWQRLYNWYYHKFVRAVRERGKIDCIGCHRCIEYCPAKINFCQVIEKLAKEQKII